ncbi:dTDP-4-dehydrorhamnose reductase [Croceicoccus bisphenolivorans]|uniref:dTDP-4-dehydrorhamnose reductase n=1 Tax=Croceicoccus bisphenolivorans TaxID=1783232 RepID=UPI000A49B07A
MVTGAGGQLAKALAQTADKGVECLMFGRDECDMADDASIVQAVRSAAPAVIVNCAAYTAVDRAEGDIALAARINGESVTTLTRAAVDCGARLVQVSTDFVFDGASANLYRPDSATNPINVYGASKLVGERAALAYADALVLRTAWVHGAGGRNFVETMLRLMAEREALDVVSDQVGTPTHTLSLARAIWGLLEIGASGVWHFTDAGVCSWYDFAVAIHEEALALNILTRDVAIRPIRSEDYPQAARRPAFSVLDKADTWRELGWISNHWRSELRLMLKCRKEQEIG